MSQTRKKNNSRGIFLTALPDIALQILSQLYFFKALQGTENGFNMMTEHQSLKINHCPPLMEGIQKNRVHVDAPLAILLSKIITDLKISKCNIRKITLGHSLA